MKVAAPRITYLFDPLCGWCYGATPALERLVDLNDIEIELAPTGLFAGENARPMDAAFAAFAWQNDQRIARLTGQTFSDANRTRILDVPIRCSTPRQLPWALSLPGWRRGP